MKKSLDILDHVRWISAFLVAISHCRTLIFVDYGAVEKTPINAIFYFVTGFGHYAVVVFFVISGYLVAPKAARLAESNRENFYRYLKDRASRIFSVFIPSILYAYIILSALSLILSDTPIVSNYDKWFSSWTTSAGKHDFNLLVAILNCLLLNEILAETLYINGAIWSLSYEWFYYLLSPVFFIVLRAKFSIAPLWFLCWVAVLTAAVLTHNSHILVLWPLWLSGGLARYLSDRSFFFTSIQRWAGIFVVIACAIAWRLWLTGTVIGDYLVAGSFLFLLSNSSWLDTKFLSQVGKQLSRFSYTLYLFHAPTLVFIIAIAQRFGFFSTRQQPSGALILLAIAVFATLLLVAKIFSIITEDQTWRLRNALGK